MKLQQLIDKLVFKSSPRAEVSFLYGQSKLEAVQITATPQDVVIVLEEQQDLSDPEKHEDHL